MDLELRAKSVLITGASKGIGLACARGFAAEGANVHLAARNTAAMEAAADDIRKKYKVKATIHTVTPGRILTERQMEHMHERAEKQFGDRGRWKEVLDKISETLPFKRTGDPSEVSDLVCYLASARASESCAPPHKNQFMFRLNANIRRIAFDLSVEVKAPPNIVRQQSN